MKALTGSAPGCLVQLASLSLQPVERRPRRRCLDKCVTRSGRRLFADGGKRRRRRRSDDGDEVRVIVSCARGRRARVSPPAQVSAADTVSPDRHGVPFPRTRPNTLSANTCEPHLRVPGKERKKKSSEKVNSRTFERGQTLRECSKGATLGLLIANSTAGSCGAVRFGRSRLCVLQVETFQRRRSDWLSHLKTVRRQLADSTPKVT